MMVGTKSCRFGVCEGCWGCDPSSTSPSVGSAHVFTPLKPRAPVHLQFLLHIPRGACSPKNQCLHHGPRKLSGNGLVAVLGTAFGVPSLSSCGWASGLACAHHFRKLGQFLSKSMRETNSWGIFYSFSGRTINGNVPACS